MNDLAKDVSSDSAAVNSVKNDTSFIAKLALALAFVHVLVFIWFVVNQNQHFHDIEKSLSKKLEQYQATNQQSFALAKQADERSVKTRVQTELIEQKLAESRDQQEVLQTLYNHWQKTAK